MNTFTIYLEIWLFVYYKVIFPEYALKIVIRIQNPIIIGWLILLISFDSEGFPMISLASRGIIASLIGSHMVLNTFN